MVSAHSKQISSYEPGARPPAGPRWTPLDPAGPRWGYQHFPSDNLDMPWVYRHFPNNDLYLQVWQGVECVIIKKKRECTESLRATLQGLFCRDCYVSVAGRHSATLEQ